MKDFNSRLAALRGAKCQGVQPVEFETPATKDIYAVGTSVEFSDTTRLSAQFWRLMKDGRPLVSIFDHREQYGLPAPIDALQLADDELRGKEILDATMDATTGDLRFRFDGELILQVFNFTAFEIWEFRFPDGTREFSNYALRD